VGGVGELGGGVEGPHPDEAQEVGLDGVDGGGQRGVEGQQVARGRGRRLGLGLEIGVHSKLKLYLGIYRKSCCRSADRVVCWLAG